MLLSFSALIFSSSYTHKVVVRLFVSLLVLLFLTAVVVQSFQVQPKGSRIRSRQSRREQLLVVRTIRSRRMAASASSSSSQSSTSYPSEWIVASLPSFSNEKNGHSKAEDDDGTTNEENTDERNRILQRTHLVLHWDINETILLGDAAGGDTRHESLQKMLAKSAFCRLPAPPSQSTTNKNDEDRAETAIDKHGAARTAWDTTRALQPTHWWDGQKIGHETKIPPLYTGWDWPEQCCPYYRTALGPRSAKVFTEEGQHGHIYQPILKACNTALAPAAASSCSASPPPIRTSSGASKQNTILPAFYETLVYLIKKYAQDQVPFTIVFRTFGSDLSEIMASVTDFAQGQHPQYPTIHFPPFCCSAGPTTTPPRLYQGRWKTTAVGIPSITSGQQQHEHEPIYELWNTEETHVVASGDTAILDVVTRNIRNNSQCCFVVGIRDDYQYWNAHAYHPTAGKPIWVPRYYHKRKTTKPNQGNEGEENDDDIQEEKDRHDNTLIDQYHHHVLFDDNIHNLPHDGIACLRQEIMTQEEGTGGTSSSSYRNVAGTDLTHYQGRHLIRVPTIAPVLNPQWYIEQLQQAQMNFAAAVVVEHQQQLQQQQPTD